MNSLTKNTKHLLDLLNKNHSSLHFVTGSKGNEYVQITISSVELNRLSEGMATLASLIALNPGYKTDKIN